MVAQVEALFRLAKWIRVRPQNKCDFDSNFICVMCNKYIHVAILYEYIIRVYNLVIARGALLLNLNMMCVRKKKRNMVLFFSEWAISLFRVSKNSNNQEKGYVFDHLEGAGEINYQNGLNHRLGCIFEPDLIFVQGLIWGPVNEHHIHLCIQVPQPGGLSYFGFKGVLHPWTLFLKT